MASIFQSTKNSRFLSGGDIHPFRYIRSDAFINPTAGDIDFLEKNGIFTVIDLRSHGEIDERPCPLKGMSSFEYRHMPVRGGNALPKSPFHVAESYIGMADQTAFDIVSLAESSKSGVLYFCTAGKDRTGVISALLLARAGARDEEIISDYMHSKENLKEAAEEYCRLTGADINIVTPRPEYITGFLSYLRTNL